MRYARPSYDPSTHLDLSNARASCCRCHHHRERHAADNQAAVDERVHKVRSKGVVALQQGQREPELEARNVFNPKIDRKGSGCSNDTCTQYTHRHTHTRTHTHSGQDVMSQNIAPLNAAQGTCWYRQAAAAAQLCGQDAQTARQQSGTASSRSPTQGKTYRPLDPRLHDVIQVCPPCCICSVYSVFHHFIV